MSCASPLCISWRLLIWLAIPMCPCTQWTSGSNDTNHLVLAVYHTPKASNLRHWNTGRTLFVYVLSSHWSLLGSRWYACWYRSIWINTRLFSICSCAIMKVILFKFLSFQGKSNRLDLMAPMHTIDLNNYAPLCRHLLAWCCHLQDIFLPWTMQFVSEMSSLTVIPEFPLWNQSLFPMFKTTHIFNTCMCGFAWSSL